MSTVNINLQAKDLTASGGQGVVDPTPDTLVQRTSTGAIKATDATTDNEVVNKKQFDKGLDSKLDKITTPNYVYVTSAQGEQAGAPKAITPDEWSIMQRGNGGRSQVNEPVDNKDIANKEYIDTGLESKLDKTTELQVVYARNSAGVDKPLKYDYSATPTVAVRGAEGRLKVGTPTANNDATTKEYVDTAIATATVLVSPNGTKYKISVNDDGTLTTTVTT